MILLMADMVDLTGDSRMPGEGVIIESNLDQRKGISAVCVIKNGTVRTGMYAVAGKSHTPVRILENFLGKHVDNATFSSPVNIIGWDVLPTVGSTFETFATREDARDAVLKNQVVVASHAEKFDENVVYVPLIVKADAGGSLEAVITQIEKVATDKVRAHVISRGIGMISEKDVQSAIGNTKAIVVGFNVGIDSPASGLALRNDIDIKTFDVIYKLTEWLAEKFVERTPKVHTEESTGTAKVIKMFSKVKDKQILGAKVETGQITLGSTVKIIRRDAEIGQGKVKELQEQKKRVDSVTEGKEFGTLIEAKIEIAVGDRIESFVVVEK
jgi:translation initiation factor IF-2